MLKSSHPWKGLISILKSLVSAIDFRASGSGNADWSQKDIDNRCIKLAIETSKRNGFLCMSYDFLFDEQGNPLISEMSYTSPDWSVWSCPGYWDQNLGWHEGHLWPEYCILSDLLSLLHDVDAVLLQLWVACSPRTRVVIGFYSNLWRPALWTATLLGRRRRSGARDDGYGHARVRYPESAPLCPILPVRRDVP